MSFVGKLRQTTPKQGLLFCLGKVLDKVNVLYFTSYQYLKKESKYRGKS